MLIWFFYSKIPIIQIVTLVKMTKGTISTAQRYKIKYRYDDNLL